MKYVLRLVVGYNHGCRGILMGVVGNSWVRIMKVEIGVGGISDIRRVFSVKDRWHCNELKGGSGVED